MTFKEISYFVMAITLVGTFANAFKKRWSFLIWIATNFFWVVYNYYLHEYQQCVIYSVNLITSIIGWYKWGKNKEK